MTHINAHECISPVAVPCQYCVIIVSMLTCGNGHSGTAVIGENIGRIVHIAAIMAINYVANLTHT